MGAPGAVVSEEMHCPVAGGRGAAALASFPVLPRSGVNAVVHKSDTTSATPTQSRANCSDTTISSLNTREIGGDAPTTAHAAAVSHARAIASDADCSLAVSLVSATATSATSAASSAAGVSPAEATPAAAGPASASAAAASSSMAAVTSSAAFAPAGASSVYSAASYTVPDPFPAVASSAAAAAASASTVTTDAAVMKEDSYETSLQEPSYTSILCICRSQGSVQQAGPGGLLRRREQSEKPIEIAATQTAEQQQQPAWGVALNDARARLSLLLRERRASSASEPAAAAETPATLQQERSTVTYSRPVETAACLQGAIEKVMRLSAESGTRRLAGRRDYAIAGGGLHLPDPTIDSKPCMPATEAQHSRCGNQTSITAPTHTDECCMQQRDILHRCSFSAELEGCKGSADINLWSHAGQSGSPHLPATPPEIVCQHVGGAGLLCGGTPCLLPEKAVLPLRAAEGRWAHASVGKTCRSEATQRMCMRATAERRGSHAAQESEYPCASKEERCLSLVRGGTWGSPCRPRECMLRSSSVVRHARGIPHLHGKFSQKAGATLTLPQISDLFNRVSDLPCRRNNSCEGKQMPHPQAGGTGFAVVGDAAGSAAHMRGVAVPAEKASVPLSESVACMQRAHLQLGGMHDVPGRYKGGDGFSEEGAEKTEGKVVRLRSMRNNSPSCGDAESSAGPRPSSQQQAISTLQTASDKVLTVASPIFEGGMPSVAACLSCKSASLASTTSNPFLRELSAAEGPLPFCRTAGAHLLRLVVQLLPHHRVRVSLPHDSFTRPIEKMFQRATAARGATTSVSGSASRPADPTRGVDEKSARQRLAAEKLLSAPEESGIAVVVEVSVAEETAVDEIAARREEAAAEVRAAGEGIIAAVGRIPHVKGPACAEGSNVARAAAFAVRHHSRSIVVECAATEKAAPASPRPKTETRTDCDGSTFSADVQVASSAPPSVAAPPEVACHALEPADAPAAAPVPVPVCAPCIARCPVAMEDAVAALAEHEATPATAAAAADFCPHDAAAAITFAVHAAPAVAHASPDAPSARASASAAAAVEEASSASMKPYHHAAVAAAEYGIKQQEREPQPSLQRIVCNCCSSVAEIMLGRNSPQSGSLSPSWYTSASDSPFLSRLCRLPSSGTSTCSNEANTFVRLPPDIAALNVCTSATVAATLAPRRLSKNAAVTFNSGKSHVALTTLSAAEAQEDAAVAGSRHTVGATAVAATAAATHAAAAALAKSAECATRTRGGDPPSGLPPAAAVPSPAATSVIAEGRVTFVAEGRSCCAQQQPISRAAVASSKGKTTTHHSSSTRSSSSNSRSSGEKIGVGSSVPRKTSGDGRPSHHTTGEGSSNSSKDIIRNNVVSNRDIDFCCGSGTVAMASEIDLRKMIDLKKTETENSSQKDAEEGSGTFVGLPVTSSTPAYTRCRIYSRCFSPRTQQLQAMTTHRRQQQQHLALLRDSILPGSTRGPHAAPLRPWQQQGPQVALQQQQVASQVQHGTALQQQGRAVQQQWEHKRVQQEVQQQQQQQGREKQHPQPELLQRRQQSLQAPQRVQSGGQQQHGQRQLIQQHLPRLLEQQQQQRKQQGAHVASGQQQQQVPSRLQQLLRVGVPQQQHWHLLLSSQQQQAPTRQDGQVEKPTPLEEQQNIQQRKQHALGEDQQQLPQAQDLPFSEQPSARGSVAAPVGCEEATPLTRDSKYPLSVLPQLQQQQKQRRQQVLPPRHGESLKQGTQQQQVEEQQRDESPWQPIQRQGHQPQLWQQRQLWQQQHHQREQQHQSWQAQQLHRPRPQLQELQQQQSSSRLVNEAEVDGRRQPPAPAPSDTASVESQQDFEQQQGREAEPSCSSSNEERNSNRSSSSSGSCCISTSDSSRSSDPCSSGGRRRSRHAGMPSAEAGRARFVYCMQGLPPDLHAEDSQIEEKREAQSHVGEGAQPSAGAAAYFAGPDAAATAASPSLTKDAALSAEMTAAMADAGMCAAAATGGRPAAGGGAADALGRRRVAIGAAAALDSSEEAASESLESHASGAASPAAAPSELVAAAATDACAASDQLLSASLPLAMAGAAAERHSAAAAVAELAERGRTPHSAFFSVKSQQQDMQGMSSRSCTAAGAVCGESSGVAAAARDSRSSPQARGAAAAAAAVVPAGGAGAAGNPRAARGGGAAAATAAAAVPARSRASTRSACCCRVRGTSGVSAVGVRSEETAGSAFFAADACNSSSREHLPGAAAAAVWRCISPSEKKYGRWDPLQQGGGTPHELPRAARAQSRGSRGRSSSCCSIRGGSSNPTTCFASPRKMSIAATDGGRYGSATGGESTARHAAAATAKATSAAATEAARALGMRLHARGIPAVEEAQCILQHMCKSGEQQLQHLPSGCCERNVTGKPWQAQPGNPSLLLRQQKQIQSRQQQMQSQQQQQHAHWQMQSHQQQHAQQQMQQISQWQLRPALCGPRPPWRVQQHLLPGIQGLLQGGTLLWRQCVSPGLQQQQRPQLQPTALLDNQQEQQQLRNRLRLQQPLKGLLQQQQEGEQQTTLEDQNFFPKQLQQQQSLFRVPQQLQHREASSLHALSTEKQRAPLLLQQQQQREYCDLLQRRQDACLTQQQVQPRISALLEQDQFAGALLQRRRPPPLLQQQQHVFKVPHSILGTPELRMQRRCCSEPRAGGRLLEQGSFSSGSVASEAAAAVVSGVPVAAVTAAEVAGEEAAASCCPLTPRDDSLALLVKDVDACNAAAAAACETGTRYGSASVGSSAAVCCPPALAYSAAAAPATVSIEDDDVLQRQSLAAAPRKAAAEAYEDWQARVEAAKQRTRESLRHMLEDDSKQPFLIVASLRDWRSLSRCCCCSCFAGCCHRWKSLTLKQRQRCRAAAIWLLTGMLLALCAVAMVCVVVMKMLMQPEVQV